MVNTNKAALADHWQTRFPLPPGPIQDAVGALLEDVVVLVDAPLGRRPRRHAPTRRPSRIMVAVSERRSTRFRRGSTPVWPAESFRL